jgi:hypothetical protein
MLPWILHRYLASPTVARATAEARTSSQTAGTRRAGRARRDRPAAGARSARRGSEDLEDLAADTLYGGTEIKRFTGLELGQIYYLLASGKFGDAVWKVGPKFIAGSKRKLRQWPAWLAEKTEAERAAKAAKKATKDT